VISDPLAKGEILAGKYRVERVIGEGGMGQVFAAEHVQLGHRVALKVLRQSALESQEAVQRFLREARAAARLQSDHIARVQDVGTLESGAPYMVMEFLEGTDLAQVLAL
jgi:serine/threonine-protein kinase